jgi:hypothetical protein
MPGKVGSASFAVFLVDGYDLLAIKPKNFTYKTESDMETSHGLGDAFEAMLPVGVQTITITQDGAFFDDTAAGAHTLLAAANSSQVSRLMAWAPEGNVIGKAFVGTQSAYAMAYEVVGAVKALTKANVTYQANGAIELGLIIQSRTAKTVDWNTKTDGNSVDYTTDPSQLVIPITSNSIANPTVVTTPVPHGLTTGQKILISGNVTSSPSINGAQTATVISATTFSVPVNVTVGGTGGSFVRANTVNGGAGYQFVPDFTGFTGFIGKIRSSADDITYADLITFTNVTGPQAKERLTVAGTIDRYISFNGDVTGAGSIGVFVGLCRF